MDKVLKITIVLSCVWLVGWGILDILDQKQNEYIGFAYPFRVSKGEPIHYHNGAYLLEKKTDIAVRNMNGEVIIDTSIHIQKIETDTANADRRGFRLPITKLSTKKLKPGLYTINENHPFIVSDENIQDVVVVYPYLSHHATSARGGSSFLRQDDDERKFDSLSLKRPLKINKNTQNLLELINDSLNAEEFTVIADADLDKFGSWRKATTLIFPDDYMFISAKARDNILKYIRNGGNVILISSYFQTNYFKRKNDYLLSDTVPHRERGLQSWSNIGVMAGQDYCISYAYGGYPKTKSWKILQEQHPIWKDMGITGKKLNLNITFLMGAVHTNDSTCRYNALATADASYNGKPNKGFLGIITKAGWQGKILCLGTSDWLKDINQNIPHNRQLMVNVLRIAKVGDF